MPELSILMKLKDEITTRIKGIMNLFNEFITHSEELAKTRKELSEKERIIEEIMAEERAAILEAQMNEARLEMELMEKVYGKKEELSDKERVIQEIMAEERAAIIEAEEGLAERELATMEKVYGSRQDFIEKERTIQEILAHEREVIVDTEEKLAEREIKTLEKVYGKREDLSVSEQKLLETKRKDRQSLLEATQKIWQKEQTEMDRHLNTQTTRTERHLAALLKKHNDFYSSVADLIDDSIQKEETLIGALGDHKKATEELTDILPDFSQELSQVSQDLSSVSSMAAAAAAEVRELRDQISKLKSKTITITVIHRDIYIVETKGGGGGSNPFSNHGGVPSAAADKLFTESRILPALKTLSREGKFAKEVVLT